MVKHGLFFCAIILAPHVATAAPILSGSFSALASIQVYQSGPSGPVSADNVPITGSFTADAARCTVGSPGAQPGCNTPPQDLAITVNLPFRSSTFSQPGGFISVQDNAGGQTLTLFAGYGFAFASAQLVLAGATDAFVDGTDYRSLHPGAVDVMNSYLLASGGREYGLTARLTSLSFTSVPEPASLALLSGLLAAAFALRNGRQLGSGQGQPRP